jgi:hypothetical protein
MIAVVDVHRHRGVTVALGQVLRAPGITILALLVLCGLQFTTRQ